ncbi:MAG: cell adhesion protein, partial [Ruthenibacterium sp.]
EGTLTLGFVNKGKGILYNLSAEISGNLENPSQMQYVGNLASGTEGSVDFDILAKTAGTVSGVITLTYEDINGVEKKQTKEYSAVVGEAPATDPGMDGMGPMMPEEPEAKKGLPWWGWALIAGGGLTAIVVIVKIIKKKKAKKIERELAEDNDDEDF